LFSSSSAHHFSTSARSSLRGTTLFTSPISSASCAEYWRQRYQISRAFFSPTTRARKPVPWPASTLPTRGPVCPKTALSDAMERSQSTWSTWPPPMAKPLTMAMPGFVMKEWRTSGGWRVIRARRSFSAWGWSGYVRGPPQRAGRSSLRRARRVEDRLPPLLPGPVGLVDLPGAHALVLRLHHVFDRGPRIAVEGLVEEPLRVGGRGRRGGAHLVDDGPERAVEVGGSAHPVDEADGARGLGAHVVVEQRKLLGPAEPDDPREAQHGAIRDEPVPRGAQADHGLVGGEAQVAGERQLEPAADRVPVQHRE